MKKEIVCIDWDDASYDSGYYEEDTPKRYDQLKTKTVGHVIKSDSKQIIVATDNWLNYDGKSEYRHITTIPKKMISKIIVLKGV
mgnify:CR=1 FL=1